MSTLSGKTALVTGASRGIGRGIAQRLAADGALVGVHYGSSEKAAQDVVATIEAAGGSAFSIQTELGVPGDAESLWSAFDQHADGIDILINNAATGSPGLLTELSEEEFDRQFAINSKAPLFIIKHGLSRIRNGGRIINISSFFTRVASPEAIAYATTKGLIPVLTPALAWELGQRDITVNAVSPGYVDTDLTSWIDGMGLREWLSSNTAGRRIGKPGDVADVVAFLASDDSRWVTGQVLEVSGGVYLGAPNRP